MNKLLRKGFTTGAAAAAATQAAILHLTGEPCKTVAVPLPNGGSLTIAIQSSGIMDDGTAFAEVIKDGGDDPDITHGAIIRAVVRRGEPGIRIQGGCGVGRVTKLGLPVPPGEAAINPVPRQMILQVIAGSPIADGLTVTIEVPEGETLALRTLNPRLGIIGGISILGTTGIVEPMSQEACQDSLELQLRVAKAAGIRTIVLTPGRQGVKTAIHYGIPEAYIVEMSNFVGFMLDQCEAYQFQSVLLWGHYGKLIKVAAGIFQTHNRVADGRLETLAAYTALCGGDRTLVRNILSANTTEMAVAYLAECKLDRLVLYQLAECAAERVRARIDLQSAGCVLLDRDGCIRGVDAGARQICEVEHWPIHG